jgi:hypothetical protein
MVENEYNKVVIELRVVQFWSEIKLVITNLNLSVCRKTDWFLIIFNIARHLWKAGSFILLVYLITMLY